MERVTLRYFHGGKFVRTKNGIEYIGGSIKSFEEDPDELCGFWLHSLAAKSGSYELTQIKDIYYANPELVSKGESGFVKVYTDAEVRVVGDLALKWRTIDIYVLHSGDSPDTLILQQSSPTKANSVKVHRSKKLTPKKVHNVQPTLRRSPRQHSKKNLHILSQTCDGTINQPPIVVPIQSTKLTQTENPTELVNQNFIDDTQYTQLQLSTHADFLLQSQSPLPLKFLDLSQYEWEDPRPSSPIPASELFKDVNLSDDDDDIGSDYCPTENEDDLQDYEYGQGDVVDEYNAEGEYEEELNKDLEDIVAPDVDTTDDESELARERVKGCKTRLLEIANKVHKAAVEGKLGDNRASIEGGDDEQQQDGYHSEYYNSEEEMDTPPESSDDETIEVRKRRRAQLIGPDTDFSKFTWKPGQRFAKREYVKQAVAKYAILQGRNVSFTVSNIKRNGRLGVTCVSGCKFRIWFSWHTRKCAYIVKSVKNEHTCLRNMEKNKQLTARWLSEQLLEVFKSRPHWPAKEIVEAVRLGYKCFISRDVAYKVKRLAHEKLHGSMKEHYGRIGRYQEAIKKASPSSVIEVVHTKENGNPTFQRIFMCFEGLRKGWVEGCRKIICIDACFLKTFLGGQLLSAVGRDGNDQMYPIAWAAVEGENNLSWEWFLSLLQTTLELGSGEGLVIVSDENQSILTGVASVLPQAEHRHCARHIFSHWHKTFKGDDFKYMFWAISKSYNEADYNGNLNKMRKDFQAAATAFEAYNPEVFCRAFQGTSAKSDVVTSNMVETFNNYIINARTKHLIDMLEEIRASLMQRIVKKREDMRKWKGTLCPRILTKLENEKEWASKCSVLPSTSVLFQVNFAMESFVVNLDDKTCTCKKWDILGIPCSHAIAAIYFCHKQPEDFVADWYRKDVYERAYAYAIPPIEGKRHWPESNLVLDPPPIKIGPGRPRKNRIKDPCESSKTPGKLTKHGVEMSCSLCKQKGHNKRRCPNRGTTSIPEEPPSKRGRGRPKKIVPNAQPSIPVRQANHHDSTAEPSRIGRGGRIITVRGRGKFVTAGRGTTGRGSGRGTTSAIGRGGGRGSGRGTGRVLPQGYGVYVSPTGATMINMPGSSRGTRLVTDGPNEMNFSQGSTTTTT